jgi:hypothetical protein
LNRTSSMRSSWRRRCLEISNSAGKARAKTDAEDSKSAGLERPGYQRQAAARSTSERIEVPGKTERRTGDRDMGRRR